MRIKGIRVFFKEPFGYDKILVSSTVEIVFKKKLSS